MLPFSTWMNQRGVDETQIDAIYNKAKISVELVRWYKPALLANVSTIANLATGSYGLFNSGENQDLLDPSEQQKIIIQSGGKVTHQQLHDPKYQSQVLQQYYPNVDARHIKPGDTIHVNVRRIIMQSKSDYEAVLQIASTIVHESTHDNEFRKVKHTSETGPVAEEHLFMRWVSNPKIQEFIQKRLQQFGPVR
jgi:hypothetical protein